MEARGEGRERKKGRVEKANKGCVRRGKTYAQILPRVIPYGKAPSCFSFASLDGFFSDAGEIHNERVE